MCLKGKVKPFYWIKKIKYKFYMANSQLDSLDYKILQMLSLNARKPYLEVSRACGVSGAAIHQRIQKLYSMGVINGSITLINPAAVGYDTCAYVGIFLNDSSKYDEVVAHLQEMPEVVGCYITTGKYDMFVKIWWNFNAWNACDKKHVRAKENINQMKDFTLQLRLNMVRYNHSIAERALNVRS